MVSSLLSLCKSLSILHPWNREKEKCYIFCLFCAVLPFGRLMALCASFVGDCLLAGSSHGASPVFGDPGSSLGVALISSYLGALVKIDYCVLFFRPCSSL